MWGSSVGGIRERAVAKVAVEKPITPRIVEEMGEEEVKEVKEVGEVKDSDSEGDPGGLGKRVRFWRRIMEAKRNMKGTMVMTTAMATRIS